MSSKRIAIFNGFPFHYEMFGCVLEYLSVRNIQFDIFSQTNNEMGWINVYKSRFGELVFNPLHEYNRNNYEYVFLLTDDDPYYKWYDGAKIIMFEHSGTRTVVRNTHQRIPLRHFTNTNNNLWCLPVWNIVNPNSNHNNNKSKTSRLKIVAIGNNCPSNPDELKEWFKDINVPEFVFINRYPAPTKFDHSSWLNYSNVRLLENIDADKMLDEAGSADWLLFLPKNEHQHKNGISAILPIAYGLGIPILMKKEWISAYNLGGMRPLNKETAVIKPSNEIIQEVIQTQNSLLMRRDLIFEKSFEKSFEKTLL